MTKYEKLLAETQNQNITVLEIDLGTNKKCGKCIATDEGNFLIINSNMNDSQKYEILSEELGHYYTSFGNIINLHDIRNIKQERRARNWAYEKLVGIITIINAFEKGIRSKTELAEYLCVTEEFLKDAIEHYRQKYGVKYKIDHYIIYFEPSLSILKLF